MTNPIPLAVIGGSGFYEMPGLSDIDELSVDTPFGAPSGPIMTGILEGERVAFLARHGAGASALPSEARSVHPGIDPNSEKAELGAPQSCAGAFDERD